MNEHWLTRHSRIEKLFTILLHCAFCGELTAAWREGHKMELLAEMRERTEYFAPHGTHSYPKKAALQGSLFKSSPSNQWENLRKAAMPTPDWRERIVIDPAIHHGVLASRVRVCLSACW